MAKSRSRKQNKHQKPTSRTIVSIPQVRARADLDALAGGFMTWIKPQIGLEPQLGKTLFKEVHALIDHHARLTGDPSVTEFTAENVYLTLEEIERTGSAASHQFAVSVVADTYLHFLEEGSLWSGSAEGFEQVHRIFDEDAPPTGIIELQDVDDEQAMAYFDSMKLVHYARDLLVWLGAGREVTETGVLKVKDLVEGAAQVGIAVRTKKTSTELTLPGLEAVPDEAGIPVVRSMHEVQRLKLIWESLRESGLLMLTNAKVAPTSDTELFLSPLVTPETRDLIQEFIGVFLIRCGDFIKDSQGALGNQIRGKLMKTLDQALYPEKPATFVQTDPATDMLATAVHSCLRELAKLGVVQIDSHYRVDLALTGSIDMFSMEVSYDSLASSPEASKLLDDLSAAPRMETRGQELSNLSGFPEPYELPRFPSALEGKSLQLRVDLEYAKPPIWRRLVVPASMNLADLHHVLQLAFGWDNSHLHSFVQPNTAGLWTLRFSDPEFGLDDTADEYEVTVGQLASEPKDTFLYDYDFGDSWRLKLVVEKVIDTEQKQPVRCLGGRMRSTVDDIGGIPGWYHAIEVLATPSHEEHGYARDMLGLKECEIFDPAAFNAASLDAKFARLLL